MITPLKSMDFRSAVSADKHNKFWLLYLKQKSSYNKIWTKIGKIIIISKICPCLLREVELYSVKKTSEIGIIISQWFDLNYIEKYQPLSCFTDSYLLENQRNK